MKSFSKKMPGKSTESSNRANSKCHGSWLPRHDNPPSVAMSKKCSSIWVVSHRMLGVWHIILGVSDTVLDVQHECVGRLAGYVRYLDWLWGKTQLDVTPPYPSPSPHTHPEKTYNFLTASSTLHWIPKRESSRGCWEPESSQATELEKDDSAPPSRFQE